MPIPAVQWEKVASWGNLRDPKHVNCQLLHGRILHWSYVTDVHVTDVDALLFKI